MGADGDYAVKTVTTSIAAGKDGKTMEWKSNALRAKCRTRAANALIASTYLSGTTDTRRVRRALAAVFAVGKDTISRVWLKVKGDWDAWNSRSFAAEPIISLILDGPGYRINMYWWRG